MNKKHLLLLSLLVVLVVFGALAAPALAKGELPTAEDPPAPTMVISLQQEKIRVNRPVAVTALLVNGGAVEIERASLSVARPAFIGLYGDASLQQRLAEPIELGGLAPGSVMPSAKTIYLALDPAAAVSGSYTLLFLMRYTQGGKEGVLSAEKTLQVDLIGSETILGVPLAFAGFVLPGLMLLVALNWFKVPFASKDNLSAEDRIIYGILISLALLGPASLLARQAGAPKAAQWLDLQQEISIERLGAYVALGLGLGVAGGGLYRLVKWLRAQQKAAALEALKFKDGDGIASLVWKGLTLNPASRNSQFYFEHKKTHARIYGYHYAESGGQLYIFPGFQLIASRLEKSVRQKVLEEAGLLDSFAGDSKRVLAVAGMLKGTADSAFQVGFPVSETQADGSGGVVHADRKYVAVDKRDYAPFPPVDTGQVGHLLELFIDEPF